MKMMKKVNLAILLLFPIILTELSSAFEILPAGMGKESIGFLIAFFLIIFAVSYTALYKSFFKENQAAAVVVALCLSGLASFFLSQSEMSIIKLIVSIMAMGIFFLLLYVFGKFAYANFGVSGVIIMIGLIFIILSQIPYSAEMSDWIYSFSQAGLYIGIPICVIGIIVGIVKGFR